MNEIPNLQEMTRIELIQYWEKAAQLLEDIQSTEKTIREELGIRLKELNQDGDVVEGWAVQIIRQIRFKTTLEEARPLGAVKTEEKVDTTVLKSLDKKGVEVPGKTIIEYVKIQRVDRGEE